MTAEIPMADSDTMVAIHALVHSYCRALDRLDVELLAGCFHEDADIDMGEIYRGDVAGFVRVAMAFMGAMRATRHCISNILIVGHGDERRVESYVDAWHLLDRDGASVELLVRARYLQHLAARNGRWAIAFHSEVVDFGVERKVNDAWFNGEIGLPRGSRDTRDLSYSVLT